MTLLLKFVLTSLLCVTTVVSSGIPTENTCNGTLHEVRITDCSSYPCKIHKNKEYKVEIDFTPTKNTSSLNVRCNTIYYGQSYQIPEERMCPGITSNGNGGCPLNNFTVYTYTVKFTVVYFVPNGHYPIRCIAVDDTRTEQLCLSATGIIVN